MGLVMSYHIVTLAAHEFARLYMPCCSSHLITLGDFAADVSWEQIETSMLIFKCHWQGMGRSLEASHEACRWLRVGCGPADQLPF